MSGAINLFPLEEETRCEDEAGIKAKDKVIR